MLSLIHLGHLSGEGHQVFEFAILTGELCARLRHLVGISIYCKKNVDWFGCAQRSQRCDSIV